jgi:lambda family phage minor tail protein L
MDVIGLSLKAPIELLEISGYNLAAPSEALYLCAVVGVSFESRSYQPIPFRSEGFDLVGQGTPPEPTVYVSNLGGVVSSWLYRCKQPGYRLEGCRVTRRLTQKQYLDGQPLANAAIREEPRHVFFLNQVAETRHECQFSLIDPFNMQGQILPSRTLMRTCPWRYRDPLTCGYTGWQEWNSLNQAVNDYALGGCAKTVEACNLRFPSGELNHGGCPGISRL